MNRFYRDIPFTKAELPMLLLYWIFGLILSFALSAFYGLSLLIGAAIVFTIVFVIFYPKLKGKYFVEADEIGIRYRQSIVHRMINIPWAYLQRIDYLEFELNFQLKETGQVISFATSGLTDDDTTELKQTISYFYEKKSIL